MDIESASVQNRARAIVADQTDEVEKAKQLFYWVRDQIPYDVYSFSPEPVDYKASTILEKGTGWCVSKANLLASLCRAVGIPSQLHFADIRNHQISEKLLEEMGTDVFFYHGYTEIYLNNRWFKATPAFNIELCRKFGHRAVEFDGESDGLLPAETLAGEKHVEYLNDRGAVADLPLETILNEFKIVYSSVDSMPND